MTRKPFLPHQKQVWKKAKRLSLLGLFLEMRLGKTLVAIRWSKTRQEKNLILIVCPKEVIRVWHLQLSEEGIYSTPLIGSSKNKFKTFVDESDKGCTYFITNKESLKSNNKTVNDRTVKGKITEIAKANWSQVIIDESTMIRNPKAGITKTVLKYINPPYKALLSGLPNPEGPEDFVCQLLWLFGSVMGCTDYYTFRARFMYELPFGGWVIKPVAAKELKSIVHNKCFPLSRQEAGIFDTKVREIRYVYAPANILKAIDLALNEFELGEELTNSKLAVLTYVSRLSGGSVEGYEHTAKLKELVNLLKGEVKGQQVVIWARYTAELYAIERYLNSKMKKLKTAIVKGQQDNGPAIDKFMAKKLDILICQPKSLQMGIDLSVASVFINISRYHDYEITAQIDDRGIHPQKKEAVLIIDIVLADTPDQCMPEVLARKGVTAHTFLSDIYKEVEAFVIK